MTRFSHSVEISVGIHAAAIGLVILLAYYHPATPLPPADASLANAIAVTVSPPPQPPSPPQPPHPQPTPPVPQPPPQAIPTQAAQADISTPPPKSVPAPSPPTQSQSTPQQAAYAQIVSAILEANKRYPRQALMAGDEGTVVVSFILNSQGVVLAYQIKKSSGQPIFDEAVRRLIQRVHFPPFPAGDHSLRKAFEVPIQYTLRS
ncbi:MAG: energy transducer TonB [Gammaproteobacteria bacterium]